MARSRNSQSRYESAVRRLIEAHDRWEQATPAERMYMSKPAPVESVLRDGDTEQSFRVALQGSVI